MHKRKSCKKHKASNDDNEDDDDDDEKDDCSQHVGRVGLVVHGSIAVNTLLPWSRFVVPNGRNVSQVFEQHLWEHGQ